MSRIGTTNISDMFIFDKTCRFGVEDDIDFIKEQCETDDSCYFFKEGTSKDFDEVIFSNVENKYCMVAEKRSTDFLEAFINIDVFDILRQLSSLRALNESLNGFDFYFFDIKDAIDIDDYIEEQKFLCPECKEDLRRYGINIRARKHYDFCNGNDRFEFDDEDYESYHCGNCGEEIDTDDFDFKH